MTLILSCVTPRYVLQVSDRLVTQTGGEFDPASNKCVIYCARNGVVTIGYSGLAHIEGMPTDKWIAEKLCGSSLNDGGRDESFGLMIGRSAQWLYVGQALNSLRRDCEKVNATSASEQPLTICLAGWEWKRRRKRYLVRPIMYNLVNDTEGDESGCVGLKSMPRYWPHSGNVAWLSVIPPQDNSDTSKPELVWLQDALKAAMKRPQPTNPQVVEDMLVTTIRSAAKRTSTVGADCMVVHIPMPTQGLVEAKYVAGESQESPSAPGLSPWIIGPNMVAGPSEITGKHCVGLGEVTVALTGPDSDSGWPPDFHEPPDELKKMYPNWRNFRAVSSVQPQHRRPYP